MTSRLLFASAWLLLATGSVLAEPPHTPRPGSTERSAILDAARAKVAADLGYGGAPRFVVESLRVSGDWALLRVQAQTPSGTALHKRCEGADELTLVLLKRNAEGWSYARGGVECANDVFWLEWPAETGAPAEIFSAD